MKTHEDQVVGHGEPLFDVNVPLSQSEQMLLTHARAAIVAILQASLLRAPTSCEDVHTYHVNPPFSTVYRITESMIKSILSGAVRSRPAENTLKLTRLIRYVVLQENSTGISLSSHPLQWKEPSLK